MSHVHVSVFASLRSGSTYYQLYHFVQNYMHL